ISCGVSQGSILGTLLFLLYINVVTFVSEHMYFTLFADDTNASNSAPNVDAAITSMDEELRRLNIWLNAICFILNIFLTLQ
ncbi:hypothetical protein CAPTEDRAFT_145916, partial [Capitella teleta]|uniref:Reverse transcriptase domain-containing protein n=1 Tax=Capitella teleta TaxID=283909 RepID=X1Z4E5_CAPTE